jgi:hypothetical protein
MSLDRSVLIWLAESRRMPGMYFYIELDGTAAYTPRADFALKFTSQRGCWAHIEEFALNNDFVPTAHCFE